MKYSVFLMLSMVFGLSLVPAYAASDKQKIDTVKHIYAEAKRKNANVLDKKYATTDFAKVIDRQKRYASRFDWENGPDDCVEFAPALIEGNGYAMEDRHTSKFYVNKKGQVVAELNFGGGDRSRMVFSLQCQSHGCKVSDIMYPDGDSIKSAILRYCPY